MCFGGGGGGSSGTYYANQDKLLGAQADIATGMYGMVQPKMSGLIDNESRMVDEANSGVLGDRARTTAGADSSEALSLALDAAQRGRDRTGAALSPEMAERNTTQAALGGASMRVGAMKGATEWAEGQKWSRTTDMYNQLQGVPTQAATQLGSAAQGFGGAAAASQANQNTMAGGLGRLGATMGGSATSNNQPRAFKDGGIVEKGGLHMASGGYTSLSATPTKPLPKLTAMQLQASHGAGQLTTAEQLASFAVPAAVAAGGRAATDAAIDWAKPFAKDAWARATSRFQTQDGSKVPVTDDLQKDYVPMASSPEDTPFEQVPVQAAAPVVDAATAIPIEAPIADAGAELANWYFKDGGQVGLRRQQHFAAGGLAGVVHAPQVTPPAAHINIPTGPSAPAAPTMEERAANMAVAQGAKQGLKSTLTASQPAAPVTDAAMTPATSEIGTAVEGQGAEALAADGLGGGAELAGAAEGGEAAAAAAAAAAEAAAAEQAALLLLLKDGGQVKQHGLRRQMADVSKIPRKDLRRGGHVKGSGTGTSDSIPAKLSNGEFVLNAEATAMIGKAKLNALNQRGLAARQGAR